MAAETLPNYKGYLRGLLKRASETAGFDTLLTLLRVSGIHYGHWDPLEEYYEALHDYTGVISQSYMEERKSLRFSLLAYSHTIEISAFHELLANVLRCCLGNRYSVSPFTHLYTIRKGKRIPPSAKAKYGELKRLAEASKEPTISTIIDVFFDDRIRNAFAHGDYCITSEEFRWTGDSHASAISLVELRLLIEQALLFHHALTEVYREWRHRFSSLPTFHKLTNYEVLELLSNDHGLFGFKVHFSNGEFALFERHPDRVECSNIYFETDGTVSFNVGSIDDMEPVWKVNGKPIVWGS